MVPPPAATWASALKLEGTTTVRVYYCRYRRLVLVCGLAATALFLAYSLAGGGVWPALSWGLAARVVMIDPGHGGVDPGAVGPSGTLEKEVTLAVGLRLARLLEAAGARVILTRQTDTDLSTPGKSLAARKREDLDNRLKLAEEFGAHLYVCVQANAFGTVWTGAQTFYHPESAEGEKLAKSLQAELRRVMGNTTRQAKALDPYILRRLEEIGVPAAMVEVGFLSNPDEERLLSDPEYQERLAYAIYAGIIHYLTGENAPTEK